MHTFGDCSFCKGEVKEEKVVLDYRYQGKLYIFEQVPAGVCQQCKELYLTAAVAKSIEKKLQTNPEKMLSVPVHIFSGNH